MNVHIKVCNFIIQANFNVLDYDVDDRVPIILGHSFLEMRRESSKVKEKTLKMRLEDE